ncbi:MAG TPA: tRNA (adenosine(37)-N6)-dimethylallyltransferase MiaA [Flavobacteriales bacterium]
MSERPTLVVVGGPTASGKTNAAATLAQRLDTEVISADSRQFYRDLRIGTARPTAEELLGVKHHFLGHLGLEETWSAGAFARAAEPVLQDILGRKGIAVMTGGSGLYIDAVLFGLDDLPPLDPTIREGLIQRAAQEGLPVLVNELQRRDPATWERIDRSNPQRVIRALEVCIGTGRPYSEQRTDPAERDDVRIIRLSMDLPRKDLYARIDARVDRMIAEGLVEEARRSLPFRTHNALRTVGYTELFEHFDDTVDLPTAIDRIKQHTRNYAKRQLTWLRRGSWRSFAPTNFAGMIAAVQS